MRTAIIAAGLAAAAAACSTLRVRSDWDRTTDFSRFKTFTLKKGIPAQDAFAQRRIEELTVIQLTSRGLQRVETGGDLEVYTHVLVGGEVRETSTTPAYAYYHTPQRDGTWWTSSGGPPVPRSDMVPVGRLTIDLVAAKAVKLVWRGVADDELRAYAGEDRAPKLAETVARVLETFPPPRWPAQ